MNNEVINMFDPTAFDNMKVVMEGALYDLDLSGRIVIMDRNDLVNMAKMSRKFDISFQLPGKTATASIEMESNLVNLAAELIPKSDTSNFAGCTVKLEFSFESAANVVDYHAIEKIFSDIWGPTRKITQTTHLKPLMNESARHIITVEFDRLIGEDQMDDLIEMLDYILTSLDRLQLMV